LLVLLHQLWWLSRWVLGYLQFALLLVSRLFEPCCIDLLLRLADFPATVERKMTELDASKSSNSVVLHSTVAGTSASLSNGSVLLASNL